MPTGTFEYRSEQERLAIERAIAFVPEMRPLARPSPDGQALRARGGRALDSGRDPLRLALQRAAQARVAAAREKGGPPASARAPGRPASSAAAGGKW